MTDKEFIDAINNPIKKDKVVRFKGTGFPSKQSYQQVWSNNKESIVSGQFGKQLAEQHFNTSINEGLLSIQDIRRIIDKENRENGK